jgi:type IV pilus assembly protein PilV
MRRRPSARTRLPRRQRGFALIEALIALLIFMLGTLGLVGLQASMTRANSSAKFRADAANLASDLVGTMWTDAPNLASYATASCNAYARCAAWENRLQARLPGASYEISPNGTSGQVAIQILWTVPAEGSHRFSTATAINMNPSL